MNLFAHIQGLVAQALIELASEGIVAGGLDTSKVTAEPPRDAAHGDVATNAAMVVAKSAGMNPKAFAELIATKLRAHADVAAVEIAGPGFINVRFVDAVWPRFLEALLKAGDTFGQSQLGQGRKVNVEYVSANPTGPLHVGHCRGAVFGDALASLLTSTGFAVTKEYYINDAGAQVDVLARSAHLRYLEALGETISIPEGLYPGDYLKAVGVALAEEHGSALRDKPESEWLAPVRNKSIAMMMELIRADLALLNIHQDVFTSEKAFHESGEVKRLLEHLKGRELVYTGRLPPPKGEVPDDWEDRDQTLFRTKAHGDDTDRPLVKSDGSFTYFASDVAYADDKIKRGFDQLVYVLGADHGGYVKRLEAVGAALAGNRKIEVDAKLCQLVKLFRNGEPVKMAKRTGTFVTLRDVVEEVGQDVVRFMMLYRKNEAPLDFDFAKVTEQSKDNPVFYVQYAHARICSVLRNAVSEGFAVNAGEPDFSLLKDDAEMAVIRRMAIYPRLIEAAALAHEPHRISFYLYDLASDFHALWNAGKESPQLRFIIPAQRLLTETRLAFLQAIRYCLANGLNLLGLKPVEEM